MRFRLALFYRCRFGTLGAHKSRQRTTLGFVGELRTIFPESNSEILSVGLFSTCDGS